MMQPLPLIRISGLAAGYADRLVINHVDLELRTGERLALLGDNGAGKSTLLLAIVGLIPITAGTIEAFGKKRQHEADFREVRLRAGMVFQDPDDQLFCPTVLEDVAFGPLNMGKTPTEARAIAISTLGKLGLADFANRITHRLSGGEKRLISIATVLAMEPDVLLLDEPTAGLDEGAYERLCTLLAGLPQAMIIVAHEARFVSRLASRAILLKDGRNHDGAIEEHSHPLLHPHFHSPGLPEAGEHG